MPLSMEKSNIPQKEHTPDLSPHPFILECLGYFRVVSQVCLRCFFKYVPHSGLIWWFTMMVESVNNHQLNKQKHPFGNKHGNVRITQLKRKIIWQQPPFWKVSVSIFGRGVCSFLRVWLDFNGHAKEHKRQWPRSFLRQIFGLSGGCMCVNIDVHL